MTKDRKMQNRIGGQVVELHFEEMKDAAEEIGWWKSQSTLDERREDNGLTVNSQGDRSLLAGRHWMTSFSWSNLSATSQSRSFSRQVDGLHSHSAEVFPALDDGDCSPWPSQVCFFPQLAALFYCIFSRNVTRTFTRIPPRIHGGRNLVR